MKKVFFSVLALTLLLSGLTAGTVLAAETSSTSTVSGSPEVGPFEGVFSGVLHGDNNSHAPIALQMTHRDGVVNGKVYLGEGLYVNAGVCGKTKIPSMVQSASGKTIPNKPNKLVVSTGFNVSGFNVGVDLTSTVSANGETLNASTSIDLPWICGRDPSYSGTLSRIQ
jgi:hypothetical protein